MLLLSYALIEEKLSNKLLTKQSFLYFNSQKLKKYFGTIGKLVIFLISDMVTFVKVSSAY